MAISAYHEGKSDGARLRQSQVNASTILKLIANHWHNNREYARGIIAGLREVSEQY